MAHRPSGFGALVPAESDVEAVAEITGGVTGPGDEHLAHGLEEAAAEAGAGHERDPAPDLQPVEPVEPGGQLSVGSSASIPDGPGGQDRRPAPVHLGRDVAGQAQRAGCDLEAGDRLPEPGPGVGFGGT